MLNQPLTILAIWTDGGSRNNPGPAGIGAIVADVSKGLEHKVILVEISEYIGQTTNNIAEYTALLTSLVKVREYLTEKNIIHTTVKLLLYTDSELMAYQLQGKYKVKNDGLRILYEEVISLLVTFHSFTITPIPRAKNQQADTLVNRAIDLALATQEG